MCSVRKNYKKLILVSSFLTAAVNAQALDVFYDAQIDSYLKEISSPLIKQSGLKNVKFYLVKSSDINAFATENKDIVFYSGLVVKSSNQNQLEGVMAHELGHLLAQHHVKSRVKNTNSGLPAIAGTVLGLGAVIAGAPQAGYAAIIGGSAAGASKQLAHSREHENEADSIAIKLLEKADVSVKGLAEFFKILQREERSFLHSNPEFLNTHPATERRKSFIQNNIISEKIANNHPNYNLFKAKVYALTEEPKKVMNKYGLEDESSAKYLALAIAAMNDGSFAPSFSYLLKAKELGLPRQWYFDMQGQIQYQNAEFEKSIASYKKSQNLGNLSWIIDFQMAESYLSLKDNRALEYFFKALTKYDEFSYTYKRISDFYAQDKQMTMAHYYLTKYYLKLKDNKKAKQHLKLAQEFYKQEKLDDEFLKQELEEKKETIKENKKKS